jgi:hypothetical protein
MTTLCVIFCCNIKWTKIWCVSHVTDVGNMSTGHLQNLGVDKRIILKQILNKYVTTWAAFIWLRIWSMAGSWNCFTEFSDYTRGMNFLTVWGGGEIFSFLSTTLVDGRAVRLCANARKEIGAIATFWTWISVRNFAGDFNACIRHNFSLVASCRYSYIQCEE